MFVERKIYLPPATPAFMADKPASSMDLSVITFDTTSAFMRHISSIDELLQYKNDTKITWINVSGLNDIESIKHIGELFSIHPLSVEDILHTGQQPKLELFDHYRFMSIKTIQRGLDFQNKQESRKKGIGLFKNKKPQYVLTEFQIDQISLILMKNILMTFQETPEDPFDGIRKRILEDIGEIRKAGTDYLAYAIIDAVVDEYFLALNHLEVDIENFEDRATKTSDATFIEEIQDTKKYVLQIRRAVTPLKENLLIITRHGSFFQTDELKPFLQDLNENLSNAITTAENHREWLSNIMDVNLSVLSHQMNKVMKVMATISTIFIPLTFIAGIYGMNFQNMPELAYQYSYPIVLGGMGLIALIMILIFRIHHWF